MTNKLCIYIFISVFCVYNFAVEGLSQRLCKDATECEYYVEGSECKDGECQCPDGLLVSGDGSKCLLGAEGYGAPCEDHVECSATLGPGGICSSSTCACAPTHHYRKGLCWRSIPLNNACSESDQCYASFDFAGVSCQDGFCKCRGEYYEREMACRRKKKNGEDCLVDEDCCPSDGPTGSNGKCSSVRICECQDSSILSVQESEKSKHTVSASDTKSNSCLPGFFVSGTDCVPEIGTGCDSVTVNCTLGNSLCIDNRECGCKGALYVRSFNNRVCNKVTIVFNGTCIESGQCAKFGGNCICDTVGTKKVCTCAEGSHFDTTNQLCRSSRYIDEKCAINEDCYAPSGKIECNDSMCKCQDGFHAANDKDCRPDGLELNDACKEDTDCLFDNSRCSEKNLCECKNNFFNRGGICLRGIGSECSEDEICFTLESKCSNSICTCPDNYVNSIDLSTCLPMVEANEACQQTDQCNSDMGELKECRDGRCGCVENAQYVLNKCYLIKKLGEKCSARAECIFPEGNPDAYICQNAKCACQYGYLSSGDECIPK